MYLTVIAWLYVVLMMSVAEAASPQGTVLGAILTFALYGVLPLAILIYIMGTGTRRRARKANEHRAVAQSMPSNEAALHGDSGQPDTSGHASASLTGRGAESTAAAPVGEKR